MRCAGTAILVLRGAWFGRAALDVQALVPRLRGAAAEGQASAAGGGARGLTAQASAAVSLRRPDVRDGAVP